MAQQAIQKGRPQSGLPFYAHFYAKGSTVSPSWNAFTEGHGEVIRFPVAKAAAAGEKAGLAAVGEAQDGAEEHGVERVCLLQQRRGPVGGQRAEALDQRRRVDAQDEVAAAELNAGERRGSPSAADRS